MIIMIHALPLAPIGSHSSNWRNNCDTLHWIVVLALYDRFSHFFSRWFVLKNAAFKSLLSIFDFILLLTSSYNISYIANDSTNILNIIHYDRQEA